MLSWPGPPALSCFILWVTLRVPDASRSLTLLLSEVFFQRISARGEHRVWSRVVEPLPVVEAVVPHGPKAPCPPLAAKLCPLVLLLLLSTFSPQITQILAEPRLGGSWGC